MKQTYTPTLSYLTFCKPNRYLVYVAYTNIHKHTLTWLNCTPTSPPLAPPRGRKQNAAK